jgi:hypothetical protein
MGNEPVGSSSCTISIASSATSSRWTASLRPGAHVQSVEHGTVMLALDDGVAADPVLDAARAAGSVEHFAFERQRLSEVFREAVRRPEVHT